MNQDNVLNSLPPFYISQKVVAIKNHSQGDFRIGDKFIIAGVRKGDCQCGKWRVAIGIKSAYNMRCTHCGTAGIPNVETDWLGMELPVLPPSKKTLQASLIVGLWRRKGS